MSTDASTNAEVHHDNELTKGRHQEACSVLYKTNIFTFFDLRTVEAFRCSILPEYWTAIRYIDIYAMFYRKDDMKDSVEARSQLQLEAWPHVCATLASMPNLRGLRIFVGNARYLDAGYLLGGRRTELYEVVLRFLQRCKISVGVEVILVSEEATHRHRKQTWDLLGLEEMAAQKLEEELAGKGVNCQIRYNKHMVF